MTPMDLLKFNPCNLDHLTETYNIGFYLDYFTRWPQLCKVIEGNNGQIEAYSAFLVISTQLTLETMLTQSSSWEGGIFTLSSTGRTL